MPRPRDKDKENTRRQAMRSTEARSQNMHARLLGGNFYFNFPFGGRGRRELIHEDDDLGKQQVKLSGDPKLSLPSLPSL